MTAILGAALAALAAALVWREIGARRRLADLERKLADADAALRDWQKVATVGEVMSGLAQELKSPLQGVLGNTELMLAAPRADRAEELLDIQENASRAAGIVRELLAFAEQGVLKRRWHDVRAIVRAGVNECRLQLDRAGVRVDVREFDRLPLVYVDGPQLERVLSTLVGEPAAVPQGAWRERPITIATRRAVEPNDHLVIELDHPMNGISDPEKWSGDLEWCRRVLEAHGGRLHVENRRTGGLRCRLELPVAAVAAAGAAGA